MPPVPLAKASSRLSAGLSTEPGWLKVDSSVDPALAPKGRAHTAVPLEMSTTARPAPRVMRREVGVVGRVRSRPCVAFRPMMLAKPLSDSSGKSGAEACGLGRAEAEVCVDVDVGVGEGVGAFAVVGGDAGG